MASSRNFPKFFGLVLRSLENKFHSTLMQWILERFKSFCGEVNFVQFAIILLVSFYFLFMQCQLKAILSFRSGFVTFKTFLS